MKSLRSQNGYALLVVIGLLTMLVLYLGAVQGSVQMTHNQGKVNATRQDKAEALAALIALTARVSQSPAQPSQWQAPNGLKARVAVTPLPASHDFWRKLPFIPPQPGDELLSIEWLNAKLTTDRLIVNRQGLRRGVIRLGGPEKALKSGAAPAKNFGKADRKS
jgi:hypothetical protein